MQVWKMVVFGLVFVPALGFADPTPQDQAKQLMFEPTKGNCLACHKIVGGVFPGNIGPTLEGIQKRFKDRAQLRAQIYDAAGRNSDTVMPPFGRHGILTEKEIDLIADYLYTL